MSVEESARARLVGVEETRAPGTLRFDIVVDGGG
jgi:hypothetical protein